MPAMRIGQLARRVGVRPSAIRYYEARGILPPPARSASEYGVYGTDAVAVLRFVLHGRELGFSLAEVRQILNAARDQPPCALTRKLAEHRLAGVEAELRRLRHLRTRLKRLLHEAPPKTSDGFCPLIDSDLADQRRGRWSSPHSSSRLP